MAEITAKRGLFFEEFNVGDTVTSQGRTITEADIVAFAALSGPRSATRATSGCRSSRSISRPSAAASCCNATTRPRRENLPAGGSCPGFLSTAGLLTR